MKSIAIALFLLFSVPEADKKLLAELRSHFGSFDKKEELCTSYLGKLEGRSSLSSTLKGYQGVLTMTMAQHVVNPYSKYKYFNKGKEILESAIKGNPFDVELRYLRYMVQIHTPDFLDYKKDMTSDKMFMKGKVNQLEDATLKKMIQEALTLKE